MVFFYNRLLKNIKLIKKSWLLLAIQMRKIILTRYVRTILSQILYYLLKQIKIYVTVCIPLLKILLDKRNLS